jgi:hypothetical protein
MGDDRPRSAFALQLKVLLKYSLLRKQEALSAELDLAASTISGWKDRGLPDDRRVQVARAFGIDAAWFDESPERFREHVIARFSPFDPQSRSIESPLLRFVPAQRVAVPGHWSRRPQLPVNSEQALLIHVPGIVRTYGRPVEDIIVLGIGVRGTVLLRPSASSVVRIDVGRDLRVPDGDQFLRMDAVGAEQRIVAICLPKPLTLSLRAHLIACSEDYVEDADLVALSDEVMVLDSPATFLMHTVDVVDL